MPVDSTAPWQDVTRLFGFVVLTLSGCSPAPPPSDVSRSTGGDVPPASASAPSAVNAPPSETAPRTTPSSPALAAIRLPFTFLRVETAPIDSFALGKPSKVAALTVGEALVFDGGAWSRIPAPDTRAPELSVEIFFGRDDQPRLMGYRSPSGQGSEEAYYRRYKAGRFQPEPSELGPLAAPKGALYGVLGHADPEVVCRPRLFCLIKRVTGWSRASAHAEPVRVVLAGGTAWALHRDRIERLERDAWVPLTPERAWSRPAALFVDPTGAPWVVEPERASVTRLVNGRWEATPSPVGAPRAIWGATERDVWLVGSNGAAHFDGETWRGVPDVTGPLEIVALSPPHLWLAGQAGIFRGTQTPEK